MAQKIKLKSDYVRDIIQNGQLFGHPHSCIWEYIKNGLQYNKSKRPKVIVEIKPKDKTVSIYDNGVGMNSKDLENFFKMHGENLDRKEGKRSSFMKAGMHGTGKSAAFGISKNWEVVTVKNNKKISVPISEKELKKLDGKFLDFGDPIFTKDKNGTVIIIKEIDKELRIKRITDFCKNKFRYTDRDLYINNTKIEYEEPACSRVINVSTKDYPEFKKTLGQANLTIKISKAPLDQEEMGGISVISKGTNHENTFAGLHKKKNINLIFGTFNIDKLDEVGEKEGAFIISRDHLNTASAIVEEIHRFIGIHLKKILDELEKEDEQRITEEQHKAYKKVCEDLEKEINSKVADYAQKLNDDKIKSEMGKGGFYKEDLEKDLNSKTGVEQGEDILASIFKLNKNSNNLNNNNSNKKSNSKLNKDFEGKKIGKNNNKEAKKNKKGGLKIVTKNMGEEYLRAKYLASENTVYINLDHPQISLIVKNNDINSQEFRFALTNIVSSEIAIGLAYLFAEKKWYTEHDEYITEIKDIIEKLSRP